MDSPERVMKKRFVTHTAHFQSDYHVEIAEKLLNPLLFALILQLSAALKNDFRPAEAQYHT